MKIRRLHVNRFGHFADCNLEFTGNGLQVIFGPNEAGKTTLLEFVRGLLFDFPMRTPYDFGGQGDLAGVGTFEMKDGRCVELRRRKGNKDKVSIKLNDQLTDFNDADWIRLLDHADRGLFESVFAFGLDQLSQGEDSLKHESLQSALFGGGLGGTISPDKVVADLNRQADALFTKAGHKRAINALMADMKQLAREIKDHTLRPEKYHEAKATALTTAQNAKLLNERVEQLRREHAKIEKLVRAWPIWWNLQQLRQERERLSVPENVPVDARQQYHALCKELKTLAEGRATRTQSLGKLEKDLAALSLDPTAVSHRSEIQSCIELRQSFIEARDQLPERQHQREALRLQIARELKELRLGWNHDNLREFTVDVATRAELDRLTEARRERVTSQTKITAKRESDAAGLERAREDLAEIGSPLDVTVLEAVLVDESDFAVNRKQSESKVSELTKLERKLATQVRKLTPPLPHTVESVHELPVPRVETVAEFEANFSNLQDQLRTIKAFFAEDDSQRRDIERLLAEATSGRAIPSLADRDAARARRDAGWTLVRRKYVHAEPVDSEVSEWLKHDAAKSLPDEYELAVREADEIADHIYDNANDVANRESLSRQLAALTQRLEQKGQQIAEIERQQVALQSKWLALWQPCGFEPLAPNAMRAWLNDFETACSTRIQLDDLAQERLRLDKQITSFEQRLRSACNRNGEGTLQLLAQARTSVDEAKDQQRKISELHRNIRRLEKQLAKHDSDLKDLAGHETSAHSEWQAVLKRLNLPDHWDPELARKVIEKLSATRVRLESLPGEDARIEAMQRRIEEFDVRVRALCSALQIELLSSPPDFAIIKLDEQVERAVEAQRLHAELSQKAGDTKGELDALQKRRAECESERARLFAATQATTESEFLDVMTQVEKALTLDNQIEQLSRGLNLIRAGDNPDEFEHTLSMSELAVLEGQARDVVESLKAAEAERKEADGAEALARENLSRLDGSDKAALLAEELAHKRSLLAATVDRYMPLVYARHLLNAAVSRFEKENQPEMIATVSRLLGQMTGGRHVEFDRTGSGTQSIVVRRNDGAERTPQQLSRGTREQVYLAIRLAYVLHYCEKNEPLPIIFDDVLVNFDRARSQQTLEALRDISQHIQVLFFTCHTHMLEIARAVEPGLTPIECPTC